MSLPQARAAKTTRTTAPAPAAAEPDVAHETAQAIGNQGMQAALAGGTLPPAVAQALPAGIGNQAMQRLAAGPMPAVQRFSVPADFSFAKQKRAALPPSIDAAPIATGNERHHIIGDRSLLSLLESELQKGKSEVGEGAEEYPVDANGWAKAALEAEVARIAQLEQTSPEAFDKMTDTQQKKLKNAIASKSDYGALADKFSGGNKAAPSLSKPEVEDTLLRVLEWMPSNLVIGREARALDPGDWLDVEALGRHPDRATRQLLAKIGIASGEIDQGTLDQLDRELTGHKHEQKWKNLVAEAKRAKATDLLAQLVTTGKTGGEGKVKKSSTGKKQKLDASTWYDILKGLITS